MANFCRSCGSQLNVGAAFCPNCGTAAGNAPPQPAAQQPYQPVAPSGLPPAAKSSSALKIVLFIFCFLVLGAVVVVAGLGYMAHRVKQAVIEKAAEQGVYLGSDHSPTIAHAESKAHFSKPCDFLTKEQVSQLIGEPIDRAEVRDVSCMYYGPAGLSAKLAQEQASGTMSRAQAPGSTTGGTEVANSVDQLVNSLGAQAGETGSGGEMPLLMLSVGEDGRSQMTALTATKAIFAGIGNGAGAKGLSMGEDVPGIGDKAVRMPKLGLNVLQGEILIRVTPGPIPDADAKTLAVARAVLPKI